MYKICKTQQSAQRQRHVVDCLLAMLQTQSFEQITVLALCERAGLPRKTFYRYFECKEDVFLAAADFLLMDYEQFDGPYHPGTAEPRTPEKDLEKMFLFWQQRQALLTAVVHNQLGGAWAERLVGQLFGGGMNPFYHEDTAGGGSAASLFVTTGLLSLVLDWIARGCPEPAAQMARQVVGLLTHPLYQRT